MEDKVSVPHFESPKILTDVPISIIFYSNKQAFYSVYCTFWNVKTNVLWKTDASRIRAANKRLRETAVKIPRPR